MPHLFSIGLMQEASVLKAFEWKLQKRAEQEKGTTEDEMVGWHHQLNGHEFEHAPGIGDGQGSMACCSPWGCEELIH